MTLSHRSIIVVASIATFVGGSAGGWGQVNRPAPRVRERDSALSEAISRGNIERLTEFLDADLALVRDAFGIFHGGKPGSFDGWTLLHEAAYRGQAGIVEELLRRGANVNARPVGRRDKHRRDTPLHVALGGTDSKVIAILLKHGADLEAEDDDGNTPLRMALARGCRDAALVLAKAGARQDVFCAAGLGNVTLLEQLLAEDPAEANARTPAGTTPLHCAAAMGEFASAKVLLSRGAAIDPEESAQWAGVGPTPLAKACLRKHLNVCRLLVESGADLEKQSNIGTALHWTVMGGDLEVARYLLSRGASLSGRARFDGNTPLHNAARGGNLEMAKLFLDFGADINVEAGPNLRPNMPEVSGADGSRPMPLDEAVSSRQREMARFLVSRGARLASGKPADLQKLLESAADAPTEE